MKKLILLAISLLIFSGCARFVAIFRSPEPARAPAPAEPAPAPTPAEKPTSPASPPAKKEAPTPPAKAPPAKAVPLPPTEEPPAPGPRLEQQATPEEERSLTATIISEIRRAEARLRRINVNALTLEANDIYETVSSFLQGARSALNLKEYQRALNLAKKARILAEDLVK